ncbi:MAG: Unknown protein [uncultured Thiotrichaceae bacterium]|uniref:Type II secretion system protein GspC N-terminal domain-containing protein n=1 Tax=uncultured Thiotrichaceae bacterium TaxID=298394 RepID=A0A6S6RU63_9GAMM|nr:MAG: Unknown protein [uncultured Thiotrichaceae bacterium]
MKRLINPPIQNLLWLGGIACLGLAVWSVWQLRQAEEQQFATAGVSVDIPNASELSIPGVRQYRRLVEAPLFWETRARPKIAPPPPKVATAVKVPEVIEVELMPPMGRLVGIVDLGAKKYALVRNESENKTLYKGDVWEGWTIQAINSERVVISAGKQRTEIALIGDFEAPAANKQMLASRQRQDQRKRNRQQQIRQAQQKQQAKQARNYDRAGGQQGAQAKQNGAVSRVNPAQQQARAAQSAQQAEPAPVLSIKEALEARQRLMASRWGKEQKK